MASEDQTMTDAVPQQDTSLDASQAAVSAEQGETKKAPATEAEAQTKTAATDATGTNSASDAMPSENGDVQKSESAGILPDSDVQAAAADPAEETPATAEAPTPSPAAPAPAPLPPVETLQDKLWKAVTLNPADFDSWTNLILETEKAGSEISQIRKVYDTFLAEFPLCFGYWKKYADHESRQKSMENAAEESKAKVTEVYESAVTAVTYSVDIWVHFTNHIAATSQDPEEIRRTYERGLKYVGTDYLSHLLWDKYLDFEKTRENWSGVAQIYTRILKLPIQQLDNYWASFRQFASSHTLKDLLTPQEAEEIERKQTERRESEAERKRVKEREREAAEAAVKTDKQEVSEGEEAERGEDSSAKKEGTGEEGEKMSVETGEGANVAEAEKETKGEGETALGDKSKGEMMEVVVSGEGEKVTTGGEEKVGAGASEVKTGPGDTGGAKGGAEGEEGGEWSEEKLKAEYVGEREGFYKAAKERDGKIREFETLVKRPYFHVKPVDEAQLNNWHRFLDFVEKEGDKERTLNIYERCVIPCANYPEFWIRFVESADELESEEKAREVLERATKIFVKRRPEIHLFAARFFERKGEIEAAVSSLDLISSSLSPGLIEAIVRKANLERRRNNVEGAIEVYSSALAKELEREKEGEVVKEGDTASEASKETYKSTIFSHLSLQFARFLDIVVGKSEEQAREVLSQAINRDASNKELWQSAIALEVARGGEDRLFRIRSLVTKALSVRTSSSSTDISVGEAPFALDASVREELAYLLVEFSDFFGTAQDVKTANVMFRTHFPYKRSSDLMSKKRAHAATEDRWSSAASGAGNKLPRVTGAYGQSSAVAPTAVPAAPVAAAQAYSYTTPGGPTYGAYPTTATWQTARPPAVTATWSSPGSVAAPQAAASPAAQTWAGYGATAQVGYGTTAGYGANYGTPAAAASGATAQPQAYAGYAAQPYAQTGSYAATPGAVGTAAQQQAGYYAQQGYYAQ